MKNFGLIFLVGILSCSSNDSLDKRNSVKKLQLIEMSGQTPNSTTTGDTMAWQEFYLLNADSTFTKTRAIGDSVLSASGKYHYQNISGTEFLKFVYPAKSELIGSCYADNAELLVLKDDTAAGTWAACDGPGLVYKWVQ